MTITSNPHTPIQKSARHMEPDAHPLRAEHPIDPETFLAIRRHAMLDGCKWDPQVGDVDTMSPFPLVLKSSTWKQIASQAERLTTEAIAAEIEISQRPELLATLGLPRALNQILADDSPETPTAGRVIRFDFHYTTQGWRISEANCDVPGGFSEGSHFTSAIAKHFPHLQTAGDPTRAWTAAIAASAGGHGAVALLSAPGYMEDHQVMAFLATHLRQRGCRAHLAKPEQIRWIDGRAYLMSAWHRGPLDTILRFYQAEWLSRLPAELGWRNFFRCGKTPVANPALAVITESKRFPLLWDKLTTPLPTWRTLLPACHDPRCVPWFRDEGWLLKTAMCNTGDTVSIPELLGPVQWLRTRVAAQMSPTHWVAQRRFESVPVPTPYGPQHVCVGVYTVNGRAAGAYARMSRKPIIDFEALDVPLLIEDDHD